MSCATKTSAAINASATKTIELTHNASELAHAAINASATKTIEMTHNASELAQRVLSIENLPKWMQLDPYIKRGYRREANSFYECFESLFYVHNELVNTWSHLAPAFFYLAMLLATDCSILCGPAKISWIDNLVIQTHIAGTGACLFLSAFYHGTSCHSEEMARRSLKLDYLGIVLTISTTCISATFFGLYGHTNMQLIYIAVTVACGMAVFRSVLHPEADGPSASIYRAVIFVGLASSGVVPIAHVAIIEGIKGLDKYPLSNILVTSAAFSAGTVVYVYRIPEKQFPGLFDVWFASHQIFHTLIVFGQFVYLMGLKRALLMHY